MQSPPIPQLIALLAVARHRSFSAAARELGVSRSAVSKSIKQLESQLDVVLVARTTRSVALTEDGRRLVEQAAPAWTQLTSAIASASVKPGEVTGRLRLTVPHAAVPFVIEPVLGPFRTRHPRVDVTVDVDEHLVDLVAEGYDAGVRMSEALQRDMVQVRLTDPFRFVVVGAPAYLDRHGVPKRPEDLKRHATIDYHSATTRNAYAWDLERGKKTWRIQPQRKLATNDNALGVAMAEQGLGLLYVFESMVAKQLRDDRLRIVLEDYAAEVPGFYLYYPSRAQRSAQLRAFVDMARRFALRRLI